MNVPSIKAAQSSAYDPNRPQPGFLLVLAHAPNTSNRTLFSLRSQNPTGWGDPPLLPFSPPSAGSSFSALV